MIDVLARYVAMPIIGVAFVVVVAAGLGALIAWLVLPSRKRMRELEAELSELSQTHARYKGDVLEHFRTTSELFGKLTESYKAVYLHLAHGAQALCSDQAVLEDSVFAASRLLAEPVLDVGAPGAASDVSAASERVGMEEHASAADGVEVPGADEASEIDEPQPRLDGADAAAEGNDGLRDRSAESEAEPRESAPRPWRMETTSHATAASTGDDDADEDEPARASFEQDRVTDDDSNRDVLAARGH